MSVLPSKWHLLEDTLLRTEVFVLTRVGQINRVVVVTRRGVCHGLCVKEYGSWTVKLPPAMSNRKEVTNCTERQCLRDTSAQTHFRKFSYF
jgi:hypothetical protein